MGRDVAVRSIQESALRGSLRAAGSLLARQRGQDNQVKAATCSISKRRETRRTVPSSLRTSITSVRAIEPGSASLAKSAIAAEANSFTRSGEAMSTPTSSLRQVSSFLVSK